MLALFLATIFWLSATTLAERIFTIRNRCTQSITLYINGQTQGLLATNGFTNRTFEDSWSGLFYTDANGGNANGAGTTRAGFYGQTNYYYIVKDPKLFNAGVSIVPKVIVNDASTSFCSSTKCDSVGCDAVYDEPPTGFPAPTASAPAAPLFECPGTSVGYTVTFCPEKTFPPTAGAVNIHPKLSSSKCLDVRGANFADATPVQIYDCNETPAQRWLITPNGGKIQLAGTPFCLDAGTIPSSGTRLKISTCSADNVPGQEWEYTSDGNARTSDQCLDLTNGSLSNSNRIQTWTCGSGNANQLWTTS
ncbi:carbohydrate-binding module family 13 protein [Hebeloma cylindrosporum]|uniref:Carbohydrate-binding module family 13 protein n=1 Tax=Hebeloma cylindrosporum TaxID=76867 RepID=A0A0C3BF84_HEBCY|nr:carbohydrate-binding module family 13 protein [Hebeloma cylindrosporum h7]